MTARLNTMTNAAERLNRSLDTTDRISDSVGTTDFSGMENAINRVANQLDRMNQRQEEAANKAKKTKGEFQKLVDTVRNLAVVNFAQTTGKQILQLADSMTTTRARLDLMNDGLQTTAELQDMIVKSANRSRAAYSTTADFTIIS